MGRICEPSLRRSLRAAPETTARVCHVRRAHGGAVGKNVLRIALEAERKVLDDARIRVAFREISVSLFGAELLRRPTKGVGVWKPRYIDDRPGGLRVMNTPSLFVLKKR